VGRDDLLIGGDAAGDQPEAVPAERCSPGDPRRGRLVKTGQTGNAVSLKDREEYGQCSPGPGQAGEPADNRVVPADDAAKQ
jgi:hypothetical protein